MPKKHSKGKRATEPSRRRWYRHPAFLLAIFAVAVVAVAGGSWVLSGANSSSRPAVASAPPSPTPAPVTMAGVQVDNASVDLGRVPLLTPESHTYELTNVGSGAAVIGKTQIQVLEGCCPPDPPVPTMSTIPPGDHALLTFSLPMGMHPGMGGKHLFKIAVPVSSGTESGTMELFFRADFR